MDVTPGQAEALSPRPRPGVQYSVMWTGTGAGMKLHNVPVMSRRGRPKHEIHPPEAGKISNDQNSNGPDKPKTKMRYGLTGQKLKMHDNQMGR